MRKFYIVFDEREKGFLTNADAFAHLVNFVEANSFSEVEEVLAQKIQKSDRHQIYSKPYKILSIEEKINE